MFSEFIQRSLPRMVKQQHSTLRTTLLTTTKQSTASLLLQCNRLQHTIRINNNNNNTITLSDIHQYLNGMTHLPTSLDKPIHPINLSLSGDMYDYLHNTNSTYTHISDMKYKLHRFVNNNIMCSVDIVVDHDIGHNDNTQHGSFDVVIKTNNHKLAFTCM